MLGKFTSLFYESPSKPSAEPIAATPKATPKAASKAAPAPPVAPVVRASVIIPGQVDPDMAKILEDAIQEANIPGFDYIEFRDVLSNMATLGLPESKTYQAAFASAQIAKVTKIQLLEAIDFYIKVIEAKGNEFNKYVTSLESTEVDGRDKAIADLDKLIEEDAINIQKLTASIGERRKQQEELRLQKSQADFDLKNKTSSFESTQATIINRLVSDRTKIDTYIQ